MAAFRDVIRGSWRAVAVLGVTEILAWGMIFYPPVLVLPLIAADRGWSTSFVMSGFSLGLLVAGCVVPIAGTLIDRYGGHCVMPVGSLLGALGLCGLAFASNKIVYIAVWAVLGTAMAASLYDSAFATLARIFGKGARRPITMLVVAGGFASTLSWPTTHFLNGMIGWQSTYLVYAAFLALVAAPLHFLALPRSCAERSSQPADKTAEEPPRKRTFIALVAAVFAANAFIFSGFSAHLLAIFTRLGVERSTVIAIAALVGPSQVTARLCEMVFARDVHPLSLARFAVGMLIAAFMMVALFGLSTPIAAAFIIMFAVTNGLMTIARGNVPLALFGPAGYGKLVGRMAGAQLIMQSAAPLAIAVMVERGSDPAVLVLMAGIAVAELVCLVVLRQRARPG
jgi:MFS family permease